MKVQFLCVYHGEIFEHLGLESITTYLKNHGHDASIVVINTTTNVYDAIKQIDSNILLVLAWHILLPNIFINCVRY